MKIDYHNERSDALSEVLNTLRIEGRVFCVSDMTAPWATKKEEQPVVYFYVIENGESIIEFHSDGEKINLRSGELVLIPHGDEHTIYNGSPSAPLILDDIFAENSINDLHYLKYKGGTGEPTNFICGIFHFINATENSLIDALPRIVRVITHNNELSRWLEPTLRLLSDEARNPKQGSAAIISQLTTIVFIQAVRIWIETNYDQQRGWLAALKDAQISRTLNLLHREPARRWTVAQVAAEIGLSRSPFAAKFKRLVGQSPIVYLNDLRMDLAVNYLRSGELNISEIAARVGYQSDAAFSKAFKKRFSKSPVAFRKS